MSREEIWVLCRATRFDEIIVIKKRDYDHWTSFQKLMKEGN